MSEKAKKKVRLNVIDILIIFLVIALIATVVYRLYTGINHKTSAASSKYVITFQTDDQYDSMVSYLSEGKAVYFLDNGQLLGNMYTPSDKNAPAYAIGSIPSENEEEEHSYKRVSIKGYIKMSSEAVKSASGGHYSIGEINVTVGSRIEVYTDEATFTLVVKSIDPK